ERRFGGGGTRAGGSGVPRGARNGARLDEERRQPAAGRSSGTGRVPAVRSYTRSAAASRRRAPGVGVRRARQRRGSREKTEQSLEHASPGTSSRSMLRRWKSITLARLALSGAQGSEWSRRSSLQVQH